MTTQETKAKHTPTPWGFTYDGSRDWTFGQKQDPQAFPAGNVWNRDTEQGQSDVDFIVRAVNSHEALLEAAKYMTDLNKNGYDTADEWDKGIKLLRKAIAQAEKKP